jgi:hypothetical protein
VRIPNGFHYLKGAHQMNARRILLLIVCIMAAAALALGGCKAAAQTAAGQSAAESAAGSPSAAAEEAAAPDAQESIRDSAEENTMQTITFQAADGLTATGDLYLTGDKAAPFILLFHQADYSRGEYRQIAPKLNTGDTTASRWISGPAGV